MKRIVTLLLTIILILPISVNSFAADSLVINIKNGDTISGIFNILASGEENITFELDGNTLGAGLKEPTLSFSTSGVEYKGAPLYIGNKKYVQKEHNGETFEITINKSSLESGDTVLTYIPWSDNFFFGEGTVYGKYNLDDQSVSKVNFNLPNGEKLPPDELILHYPVENSGDVREERVKYDPNKKYALGDGWSAATGLGGTTPDTPIYISFIYKDLLSKIENAKGFATALDTRALSDGEHTLTVLSNDEPIKDIKFIVDNTAPTISLPFEFGEALSSDYVLAFTANDQSGDVTIKADIDGKTFISGRTLERFNEGKHLLTVTASDKFGNSSIICAEFAVYKKSEISTENLEKLTSTPTVSGDSAEYVFNVGEKKKFTFEYLGKTNESGEILIFAFDYVENEYKEITTAFSGERHLVTVEDERFIKDGEVKIKASPKKYISNSNTVVWITDTQYYSKFDDLHSVYELLLNYSIGLFNENKAGYLIHTGDIVDTPGSSADALNEWVFANKIHKLLDNAKMPYGVLAGNHDTGNYPPTLDNFKKYFSDTRFSDNLWYGGNIDKNTCHYDLLTIAGEDYLFMYLSNGVEAEPKTIAWANAVCKAYSNRTVIICVHPYLGADGQYVKNDANPSEYNDSRSDEIIEYIIKPNENVAAVLCGHDHGAVRKKLELENGRYVWEILSDYQYAETGEEPNHVINGQKCDGEGYLRLITFGENGEMHQTTYSPLHDDYNFFSEDQDTFTVTLQTKDGVELISEEAALYIERDTKAPIIDDEKEPPITLIAVIAICVLALAGGTFFFVKKKSK